MKFNRRDARSIIEEARVNVERLRDGFAAGREEQEAVVRESTVVSSVPIESMNERHRREIDEQDASFEFARRERKREEHRHKVADWSQWDAWADAKIVSAIANERRVVCETLGVEVRKAIEQIYDDMGAEVKELRIEILNLQAALNQSVIELRGLAKSDGAKVIDMPKRASN
jgi:hypothetical protein